MGQLSSEELAAMVKNLSEEQRELLAILLKEQGIDLDSSIILPSKREKVSSSVFQSLSLSEHHPARQVDLSQDSIYLMPLSYAQQRMWFLDQWEPNSAMYNMTSVVRMTGVLRNDFLEQAVNQIVKRHETLRSTFITKDGQPFQLIIPKLEYRIPVIDISEFPSECQDEEASRLAKLEASTPFSLSEGPLLRVSLIRITQQMHIALFTFHHSIADGWSVGVFIREIALVYRSLWDRKTPDLPELSIQYADFAVWQQRWLQREVFTEQENFWKDRLGSNPPVLNLPTDLPKPAVLSSHGASYSFQLSEDLSRKISFLGQNHGATLFMTMLAAFQVLLSRYSGQDDICVGTPIANRTRAELEGLIGFFANTLVIRTKLSNDPSFIDLLDRVRSDTLEAYSHQDLPFEMLVETLQPERDLSHSPLFQVMFSLQNTPQQAFRLPELTLEALRTHSDTAKFEITLIMTETPDGLTGDIEYNTDLFEKPTIARMMSHFKNLLEGILDQPDMPISHVPILTQAERQHILFGLNDTDIDYRTGGVYSSDECLHTLLDQQAYRTPDRIAVLFPTIGRTKSLNNNHHSSEEELNPSLTYRALREKTNQLSHYLRNMGVEKGMMVGISAERSLEMVIALIAVQKAGGAYVPIDPTYPLDRLGFLASDSGVKVILTQEHLRDKLAEALNNSTLPPFPDSGAPAIISLDSDWPKIEKESADEPACARDDPQLTPDDLIYMIYTSGSTGKPKGVLVHHRGVVNRLLWGQEHYQLTQSDRVMQKTPYSFDVSGWEFYWPLLTGATLVVSKPEGHKDPTYLIDLIHDQQITIIHFVPPMLNVFLDDPDAATCTTLTKVFCSGEALPYVLQERFFEQFPTAELHNLYGPTEASIEVTYWECQRNSPRRIVPIGFPVANTQMYVLDKWLEPVPMGVAGELHIGGVQVGKGYLNRDALSKEKFIDDPHRPGGKLYKTGDLARYLPDGAIEYLGRIDFQVKIHGFRIELGEIEAILAEHPGVREVVVMAREDPPAVGQAKTGDRRLVAYFVPNGETAPKISELRSFLKEKLPDYMVPSAFVILSAFPINPNGKVDRAALPAPEISRGTLERKYVAPRNPEEELLVNIWQDVLGVKQIGVEDNFFELGGHSLLVTQVTSRIRRVFGVDLPVRSLFESFTISKLALRISTEQLKSWTTGDSLDIPPAISPFRVFPRLGEESLESELLLSFPQQRLWFLDQFQPGQATYNIPSLFRLRGGLNIKALEESINAIIERHEIFRTGVVTYGGRPKLSILSDYKISLPIIDLTSLPADERLNAAIEAATLDFKKPFDLSQAPLLRIKMFLLSGNQFAEFSDNQSTPGVVIDPQDGDYILMLNMHHIITDGWSISVIINELLVLYKAHVIGQAGPDLLPSLAIQYADYAQWQREWLSGASLKNQVDFWREQLLGAPPLLELPTDRPRLAVQSLNGSQLHFEVGDLLTENLQNLSRKNNVTLFMTLLAAFQVLLYRYSGQADICVGTPVANRRFAELENLVGFFVNTLVIRSDLNPSSKDSPGECLNFEKLLAQVRETCLGAYSHQDIPFEMLVNELQPERNTSHSPLFQVMFVLQNIPAGTLNLNAGENSPELIMEPVEFTTPVSKFDLTLTMAEGKSGLAGVFEYNTDLFDQTTIQRVAEHYLNILKQVVSDPIQPVNLIDFIGLEERALILGDFSGIQQYSELTYDTFENKISVPGVLQPLPTIVDLFERQAELFPDRLAVIGESLQTQYNIPGIEKLRFPGNWSLASITYQALNEMANQLAHRLLKAGVRPNMLVGLMVERSVEMIVGLLGILKAGGAYLPLDPTYPADRIAFILNDAQAPVVVTQKSLVDNQFVTKLDSQIDGLAPLMILVDHEWVDNIALERNSNPAKSAQSEDLAYVIYTSGSTGKPKGVMIEHHSAINLWAGLSKAIYSNHLSLDSTSYLPTTETEPLRVSLNAPLLFDASVQEWVMLMSGHCLVVIPNSARADGRALLEYIRQTRIDVLDCVPSQLKLLLQAGLLSDGGWTPQAILPGGEAIDEPTWRQLASSTKAEFYNMYGPTECTVDSTIGWVKTRPDRPMIGRPVVNASLFVLDSNQQLVPTGVPGELYIAGAGVGRGYLNRPELTNERFIQLPIKQQLSILFPWLSPNHLRAYRTGDRVRFMPDGNLEFYGRLDDQVKVRGFRIELGEIETILADHPQIREAAVLVREVKPGEKQLVAYISQQSEFKPEKARSTPVNDTLSPEQISVGQLRSFLKSKLPEYMIPALFIILPALPLTPNAKIDRLALKSRPLEDETRLKLDTAYEESRTVEEKILIEVWSQVLGIEKIGIHDNFFELGGDSILSIQVTSRANQAGLKITPRQIFESQTIAELAAAVVSQSHVEVQAEQGLVTGVFPLTPVQRWLLDLRLTNLSHFNQSLLFDVTDEFYPALFERVIYRILAHHDALRLRLQPSPENDTVAANFSGWSQRIVEMPDVENAHSLFEIVDLRAVAEDTRNRALQEKIEQTQASLNVFTGPILKVIYFDFGPGIPGRLLIVIHHLAIDGVSWRILIEDLLSGYNQLVKYLTEHTIKPDEEEIQIQLPSKTTSIRYWASKLNEYAHTSESLSELDYWIQVASEPCDELPIANPEGNNIEASTRVIRVNLEAEQTRQLLQEVPAVYKTEINDVLLTALILTIRNWRRINADSNAGFLQPRAGKSSLLIAMEGHGREDLFSDIDLSRTVGWFTTIYPLRLALKDNDNNGEAIRKIKEQIRQVPRRGIGYGLLRYLRQDSANSLAALNQPRIAFNYLGQVDANLGLDKNSPSMPFKVASESSGTPHDLRNPRAYWLEINGGVLQGRLGLDWSFSANLFAPEQVQLLADQYIECLHGLINHCLSPDAGGFTTSDFPLAGIDQMKLDKVLSKVGGNKISNGKNK